MTNLKNKKLTSRQYNSARKYNKFSVFILAPLLVIVCLISYYLGILWVGLLIGAVGIAVEGIISYKIGAISPLHGKNHLFGKKGFIIYLVFALIITSISLIFLNSESNFRGKTTKDSFDNILSSSCNSSIIDEFTNDDNYFIKLNNLPFEVDTSIITPQLERDNQIRCVISRTIDKGELTKYLTFLFTPSLHDLNPIRVWVHNGNTIDDVARSPNDQQSKSFPKFNIYGKLYQQKDDISLYVFVDDEANQITTNEPVKLRAIKTMALKNSSKYYISMDIDLIDRNDDRLTSFLDKYSEICKQITRIDGTVDITRCIREEYKPELNNLVYGKFIANGLSEKESERVKYIQKVLSAFTSKIY